jgi:Integrase core domain
MARALSPSFKGRPARTHVLPVPHVPDGLTIAPIRRSAGRQGTEAIMPDNGIVERFHKTVLNEFYRVAFRKKIYRAIPELQADLETWIRSYNEDRPHQGRWCFGKTPMQTFLDAIPLAREKVIAA